MDQKPVSFENIVLPKEHEETMRSIGQEVVERQVDYSAAGIEKPRKDIFKEVLGQRMQVQGGSPQASPAPQTSTGPSDSDKVEIKNKSEQLQQLVNIAATKGPIEASLMAQKIGDPWLEDQLHDALISFHDELVSRRKLAEE